MPCHRSCASAPGMEVLASPTKQRSKRATCLSKFAKYVALAFGIGDAVLTILHRGVQIMDESFGLYLWPSASLLAKVVWANRVQMRGASVLELGAGVGLPGMVAAAAGADVVLSDRSSLQTVLRNCEATCEHNDLRARVVRSCLWSSVRFRGPRVTMAAVSLRLASHGANSLHWSSPCPSSTTCSGQTCCTTPTVGAYVSMSCRERGQPDEWRAMGVPQPSTTSSPRLRTFFSGAIRVLPS